MATDLDFSPPTGDPLPAPWGADRVQPVITASNISMRFGSVQALDSVSVEVAPGITGLIGANGAGKTTLMSIVLGIQHPTTGSARVLGYDPRSEPVGLRQRVAFVPERSVMPDDLRALEYVTHLTRMKGIPRRSAEVAASDALSLVGLGEERTRQIGTMSTGQRQRVKLAQAIAASPDLVLLDEPTSGLDPAQRSNVLALVATIARDFKISFLLSSHLLEEVEQICEYIIALSEGRLVAAGSRSELFSGTDAGIRIEFAQTLTPTHVSVIMEAIVSRLEGATARDVGGYPDAAIVITPKAHTPRTDVAAACRDVIADEGLSLRSLGPNRRSLRDLFELNAARRTADASARAEAAEPGARDLT